MNRTAIGMPIWIGLLSLTLAATGQAQIIAVRPTFGPTSGPASGLDQQPNMATRASFQDPAVLGELSLAPPAPSAPAPAAIGPGLAAPALAPPAAGAPAAVEPALSEALPGSGEVVAAAPFNVGNNAWEVPNAGASPNWEAIMAPAASGPPPTIEAPPGQYEAYTPAGGGFLGGGFLRMLCGGNTAGPAIAASGSQPLFAGWRDWAPPAADHEPGYGVYLFEGFETWRSIPDGNTRPHGNNGATQGFNLAAPIPWLAAYGFGGQVGMSYGTFGSQADTEQQIFVTTGIFRRADFDRPFSFGLVYDQMINQGFGAYQQSPALGQLRLQMAYAFTARNEVGFWGALRLNEADRAGPAGSVVEYRGISQGQIFWHHKFGPGKTDAWAWTGLPSNYRLNGDNSFETNIYGWRTETPLSDRVMLFSNFQGLRPTGGVSHHAIYDFMVGMSFYPSRNARSTTVAGRTWMPYIPVANNGSFLVDTNQTF
jgi:hypothetical protein